MSARTKWVGALVAGVLGVGVLTACGPTMRDIPLPGSGVSGDTITVTVQFDEALNLAQGASVKVNGVDSGKVQSVKAKNFKAVATLKVRKAAKMRTDATARLRYTTPLGELFVDVSNPARGPLLQDGDAVAKKNASTAPTVEDALSSASLLINGGGLNQLQTVTEELNAAVGGREGKVRALLDNADTFLTEANATTGDIDAALRALAGVSKVLNDNRSTIDAAMKDIRPAARVLRENTPDFTRLLAKLAEFADTANDVVGKTRGQILQMVREVGPVLDELLAVKEDLGPSFDDLVNLSKLFKAAVPGDYANMKLTIEFDKLSLPNLLGPGGGGSTGKAGTQKSASTGNTSGLGAIGDAINGLLGGPSKKPPTTKPAPPSLLSLLLGGGK
ncbi:phospholipid/cholesterol/gamma-HCH transport system substrate-binding protein [Marmoricola sp. OAE513]|uniref:MCE family protein n=1 Tax=Marmoricola sp. OAE513 TaxID=2817894 RepID=UPI001AE5DE86